MVQYLTNPMPQVSAPNGSKVYWHSGMSLFKGQPFNLSNVNGQTLIEGTGAGANPGEATPNGGGGVAAGNAPQSTTYPSFWMNHPGLNLGYHGAMCDAVVTFGLCAGQSSNGAGPFSSEARYIGISANSMPNVAAFVFGSGQQKTNAKFITAFNSATAAFDFCAGTNSCGEGGMAESDYNITNNVNSCLPNTVKATLGNWSVPAATSQYILWNVTAGSVQPQMRQTMMTQGVVGNGTTYTGATAPNFPYGVEVVGISTIGGIQTSAVGVGGDGVHAYVVGDWGTVNSGTFAAVYAVDAVSGGLVTQYHISQVGSGYSVATLSTTAKSGVGQGFTINVTAVLPAQNITNPTSTSDTNVGPPSVATMNVGTTWGATFIQNAWISVESCSIAGYNGMFQILNNAAGTASLTYSLPGFKNLGNATGCQVTNVAGNFVNGAVTPGFQAGSTVPYTAANQIATLFANNSGVSDSGTGGTGTASFSGVGFRLNTVSTGVQYGGVAPWKNDSTVSNACTTANGGELPAMGFDINTLTWGSDNSETEGKLTGMCVGCNGNSDGIDINNHLSGTAVNLTSVRLSRNWWNAQAHGVTDTILRNISGGATGQNTLTDEFNGNVLNRGQNKVVPFYGVGRQGLPFGFGLNTSNGTATNNAVSKGVFIDQADNLVGFNGAMTDVTATEATNTVTLTTYTGNFGAQYVVGATIHTECPPTYTAGQFVTSGYNINALIATGGSGTATLTYTDATAGLANSSPCTVAVLPSPSYSIPLTGFASFTHLNQTAAGNYANTCAMSAGTTCTFSASAAYTGTPIGFASVQSAAPTTFQGSCALSGTTVTITASAANSNTWGCLLIGNPN